MESPLSPESWMVHISEIGCAQNCHKDWENWAQIGLFGTLSGGIFKKNLYQVILDQNIFSYEPN